MDNPCSEPATSEINQSSTHKIELCWWCDLLASVLGCAIAIVLMIFFDLFVAASLILIAVVGRVLYRWTGTNRLGIVLWCMAAMTFSITMPAAFSEPYGADSETKALCSAIGILLTIASIVIFILSAAKDQTSLGGKCGERFWLFPHS